MACGPTALVASGRPLFAELLEAHLRVVGHVRVAEGSTDPTPAAFGEAQLLVVDGTIGSQNETVRALCLKATRHGVPILVVAAAPDRVAMAEWIERGVSAFVNDDASVAILRETARQLAHGHTVLGVSVRESLLSELRTSRAKNQERFASFDELTKREADVLRHLAHGVSPEEVARASYVSLNTIRTQIRGILAKLDVSSVVAAVALAYRTGWLHADLSD